MSSAGGPSGSSLPLTPTPRRSWTAGLRSPGEPSGAPCWRRGRRLPYRLIVKVDYRANLLLVKAFLTHKEYDRGEWKKWAQ